MNPTQKQFSLTGVSLNKANAYHFITRYLPMASCLFLASTIHTFGIDGLGIERQGTNVVISWPSLGYEHYLIQYRETLDSSTPWTSLTNNYPANSTNRTMFTLYGVVPPPGGGGGGGSGGPPTPEGASQSGGEEDAMPPQALALPLNGSSAPLPLCIYPPGFDLSNFAIYDPPIGDCVKGSEYVRDESVGGFGAPETDGPQPGGWDELPTDSCFFRVFHIPDWLGDVENYTFDGPIFIDVDFKDYLDRVENVEVLLNGQPISDAVLTSIDYMGETYWGVWIYFDLFPSGTNQIQLRSTLRVNDEIGDESVYLVLSNVARTIIIDNQVTFTNWDGLILSSNFTFEAQTKIQETDWWIDIYDAGENYVNTGSGHTTNGQISWTWDVTDWQGNPRDDLDYDPFFYAEITFDTAGDGPQTTRRAPAPQTEYPNVGSWLITYSDRHFLDAGSNYLNGDQYYTNGVVGIAGGPSYRGIPVSLFPIKFGTNVYTQQERDYSWASLKSTLFDVHYRNLYYHGHGSANAIGADTHVFDTNGYVKGGMRLPRSKAYLTSQSVSNELTFNRYSGARPYRFVWLDGCYTANGNWPGAFGVRKTTNSLSYYTNSVSNPKHRRPSAFTGWNQVVGGQGWGNAQDAWYFRSQWMFDWMYYMQTRTLVDAFGNARQTANWPPGGDGQLWGALRVYGYTVIRFDEYNHKSEWRWP